MSKMTSMYLCTEHAVRRRARAQDFRQALHQVGVSQDFADPRLVPESWIKVLDRSTCHACSSQRLREKGAASSWYAAQEVATRWHHRRSQSVSGRVRGD